MKNFSGINFSYTNRLHFLLVITVHFVKNDLLKSTSNKNHCQIKIIFLSSQFTECVQHQVLNQIQQQIYKFLLSPFLFKQFQTKN